MYFAYKEIKPITVTDGIYFLSFNTDLDEVSELCENKVFEYPGIEDVESISEFEQHLKYHCNFLNLIQRFFSCFNTNGRKFIV